MSEIETTRASEAPPRPIRVEIGADSTIGYASLQNDVPLIRELRITNDSPDTLTDVELFVESDPPFAEGARLRFDRLDVGESRRISPVDIHPQQAKDCVEKTVETFTARNGGLDAAMQGLDDRNITRPPTTGSWLRVPQPGKESRKIVRLPVIESTSLRKAA